MRIKASTARACLSWLTAAMTLACNTLDDPPDESGFGGQISIPLDERPPVQAAMPALPITGGTLRVTRDGRFAVAADPERDRISVVALDAPALLHEIALPPGSEPARMAEDAMGRMHVALRRGGAIVTIDPATGAVLERRAVCRAPRGLDYDAQSRRLHVACAEGKLVSLEAGVAEPVRVIATEPDLRDVIVRGSELWVTRFKSAQLLRYDANGNYVGAVIPPEGQRHAPFRDDRPSPIPEFQTMRSEVAWRAVPTADGGAMIVHQQALQDELELTKPNIRGSAYGGGVDGSGFGSCDGIVRTQITRIGPNGMPMETTALHAPPLPVDLAVAPNGAIAVAHAGPAEPGLPRPTVVFRDQDSPLVGFPDRIDNLPTVSLLGPMEGSNDVLPTGRPDGCQFPSSPQVDAPATAVAFAPDGMLITQTREPAELWITPNQVAPAVRVALGGDSRLDSGHELFHRDSGGGIACASCHPEGGEDGHVWQFEDVGARRTQALHVGLRGTAPFHWNGDLPDVAALMTQVFVGRMGGIRQTPARLQRLSEWLFDLPRPTPIRTADDASALRGKSLFESAELACTSCHAGQQFTDNRTVAVGTAGGTATQVPSLIAVGWRAPFMHDGCAATLAARFDPKCGGSKHGNTAQLGPDQIADLTAYLESL